MNTFNNKTVFLSVGGSGIGRSLALLLAQHGGIVCITVINLDSVRRVAEAPNSYSYHPAAPN